MELKKSREGRELKCVVTDRFGAKAESETAFLLYDYPEDYVLPFIITQPADASAANKARVTVSVEARGVELSYRWYYLDPGAEKWVATTRAAAYSVAMSDARNGRQVYCVVTDRFGNKAVSETVTMSMIG